MDNLKVHDVILKHDEIDKIVSFPNSVKNEAKLSHNINFFIKRSGGYYILCILILFNLKKISCTIEILNHYIPHSVCSKATLSSIINEAIQNGILIKEDCKKDRRIKKIIPSKLMIEEWTKFESTLLTDFKK